MTSIDHQNEFFEKYDARIYDVFDNSCELAESEPCYFNDVFNTKIPSAELGSDINIVDNNHLLSSNIPNGLNRDIVNNNDGGNNNTKINNRNNVDSKPIATPEISLQTVNPTQSITGNPVLTPSEHSNFNNTMNLVNSQLKLFPSPLNTSSRTNGATGLTLNNASNSSFIAFGASSPSPIGPYTPSRIYPVPTLTSTILLDNSAFIFCDYQNDVIGMFHTTNVLNQFLARSKNLFNAVHTAKQKKKLHCISIGLSFRPNYPEVSPNNRYFENYKNSGRLVEGTKGAEFIDGLQPREHDIVIQRRRVDAFYNTDLQMILESLNIKHIILAGISTADVILSTSLSAADRDLCVTVVRECCFEGNDSVQNVLMDEIFPKQGVIVAPFQDIIDTLRSA
ncbi:1069_t:CDS:10 [Entrophospora sp. SA101]|nr:1069_t:CDS:10 [Entrophospora sp. SA101]